MINKQQLYSIALVSAAMILMLVSIAGAVPFAYITNYGSGNVSVIDTATNTITATVNLEDANYVAYPWGIAVAPDGAKVYVMEFRSSKNNNRDDYGSNVAVIDTATNTVTATVPVGSSYITNTGSYLCDSNPYGIAVSPDGTKLYVVVNDDYPTYKDYPTVMVINTKTNTITATVPVGAAPGLLNGIVVTPDGTKAYVANTDVGNTGADHQVAVIDTATNTVTATVLVGNVPDGVAVTPDGAKVYVSNRYDSNVSVIDTATNTVTASVPVGSIPAGVSVTPDGTKV
jgi:YVTN family beta-propeller protein